jgi:hypothetical protein
VELGTVHVATKGRLMAAPTTVYTARFAAKRFRVDIDVIEELAELMSPELGCLSVVNEMGEMAEAVTAFTSDGLSYLEELLDDRRSEFMKDL